MKRRLAFTLFLLGTFGALSGCAEPAALTDVSSAAFGATPGTPTASLAVSGSDVAVDHTSALVWSLTKTGVVNTVASTVVWQLTATEGTTLSQELAVSGLLTLTNDGAAPAVIGNVVVNLQTKSAGAKWSTRSANVSNATEGDAATAAKVVAHGSSEGRGSFTENAASGKVQFVNVATSAPHALESAAPVAPGATVVLRFRATFDNAVLALPAGTEVRTEVLVSFGNSNGNASNSATNLDINGNGVVDALEARVRTVPTRHGGSVPALNATNPTVVLTDTPDDISTTGTVTWSNPVFLLGATSGTVQVAYSGGASGGTITNCARLVGTNVQTCDTKTVVGSVPVCTAGCTWQAGEFVTFTQASWGSTSQADVPFFTISSFDANYFPSGVLTVGSLHTMSFSSPTAVANFLPAIGAAGQLTTTLANPSSSPAGGFGGEVVALKLNIDFSSQTGGTSALGFGDLRICKYTTSPSLNGMTVNQILGISNTLLGGETAPPHTVDVINDVAAALNASFYEGGPSAFAQAHLFNGACPTPALPWESGNYTTYQQAGWAVGGVASTLRDTYYPAVYLANGNVVEVGIPGATGFSLRFTNTTAVIGYLPAGGPVGPLNSDLLNPTTTASGAFGGEALTLRLNIDFADAGFMPSSATIPFGDLIICNYSVTALNGSTVRSILSVANTLLGGGSAPYPLLTIALLAAELNAAFDQGSPNAWAQAHLRPGPCL